MIYSTINVHHAAVQEFLIGDEIYEGIEMWLQRIKRYIWERTGELVELILDTNNPQEVEKFEMACNIVTAWNKQKRRI